MWNYEKNIYATQQTAIWIVEVSTDQTKLQQIPALINLLLSYDALFQLWSSASVKFTKMDRSTVATAKALVEDTQNA